MPMRNFRSALRMVVRNVFSALGVSKLVWINRMPNSFGPCVKEVVEEAVRTLDGVWGVIGVRGNGVLGVGGTTQRRGLTSSSVGGGGNDGDDTAVLGKESDVVDDTVDVEFPVPLRTSCLSPMTGEANRGDIIPGVGGGEVGVGHGGIMLGS